MALLQYIRYLKKWKRSKKVLYDLYQSSYEEIREKAGVSKMYVDRLRTVMCEVYKVVNDIGPAVSRNILP